MPGHRWIFFDCFNTLLDEADRLRGESGMEQLAQLPVEAGLFETPEAFIEAYFQWRSSAWEDDEWCEIDLAERLTAVLGDSQSELVDAMVARFEETFASTLRITPGAARMLEDMGKCYSLGVVSNFFIPHMPAALLGDFGLDGAFSFIIDSAEFGYKKPDGRIYAAALERAGVRASDVVFVGDNLRNDALTPNGLGMRGIHFNRSPAPDSNDFPVDSFASWSDFADLLEE